MKKLLYAVLLAGIFIASCGFVAAEHSPDAIKAQYPAKIDLGDSQSTIKGVAAPQNTMAEEIIPTDPLDILLEELDPNDYGSVYMDDENRTTITAINREAVDKALEKHGLSKEIRIVDGTYSKAQLDAAQEAISEKMKAFSIVAIGQEAESLAVWLRQDTQENRTRILELAAPVTAIHFINAGNSPLPKNT